MRAWLLAIGVIAAAQAQDIAPRAQVTLRFHHLHYSVDDPAAAARRVAAATGGTRLLVPAQGPGVKIGSEYVIFERGVSAEAITDGAAGVETSYRQAARWLSRRGVNALESASGGPKLAASVGNERLDHIGFAADDFDRAVRAVEATGAAPLRRSADAAMFKVPDGPRIEIVRDSDGVDAYWCPMHADVRAAVPGTCPVCGMTLVPIVAPVLGEYRMDVAVDAFPGGIRRLRLAFFEPSGDRPVSSFVTVHERSLHVFIVGRDLEFFRHVHPEPQSDGTFLLNESLPSGEYVVIADVLPQGGTAQMLHRAIVAPPVKGPLFRDPPVLADRATTRVVDGVRVTLDASGLRRGREAVLRVTVADAATGQPVADLEPFLGAPAHMLIVNRDVTEAIHAHPEADLPPVTFAPRMPAEGAYKVWVQFQRGGRVSTVPFVVSVQ